MTNYTIDNEFEELIEATNNEVNEFSYFNTIEEAEHQSYLNFIKYVHQPNRES